MTEKQGLWSSSVRRRKIKQTHRALSKPLCEASQNPVLSLQWTPLKRSFTSQRCPGDSESQRHSSSQRSWKNLHWQMPGHRVWRQEEMNQDKEFYQEIKGETEEKQSSRQSASPSLFQLQLGCWFSTLESLSSFHLQLSSQQSPPEPRRVLLALLASRETQPAAPDPEEPEGSRGTHRQWFHNRFNPVFATAKHTVLLPL